MKKYRDLNRNDVQYQVDVSEPALTATHSLCDLSGTGAIMTGGEVIKVTA